MELMGEKYGAISETVFMENQACYEEDRCDRALLFSVLCLLIFGVLMVYSSTSVVPPAQEGVVKTDHGLSQFLYLKRHILSLTTGLIFMFVAYRFNLKRLYAISLPLLVLAVVLILLVFMPNVGMKINGARRWIRFWPSSIQPSEFAKLAMIIFLARYMSSPRFDPRKFVSYAKPVVIMVMFQVLFLLQPDFGSAMAMALITLTMLFLSGVRKRYLISTVLLLIPAAAWLIQTPYRWRRITSFLDPWSDQQGAGYQLVQSFIALGSGGLTGIGLGESKQKLSFLPYSNTDFIFSLTGEELGFIGVSIIMALFGVFFWRGVRIATQKKDLFHYYLAKGLTYLIIYQVLINISVVTGLVPTKGLPLPFISYGGSALFVNLIAVGFMLNLSKRYQPAVQQECTDDRLKRKKARISVYGRGEHARRIR